MSEPINGFVPGVVIDDVDPDGTGRVKVAIPGMFDVGTPYWVMPAGWPGAGKVGEGSQYPPPPIGAQVFVIFEHGVWDEPDSRAIYLTGYYGVVADAASAGPSIVAAATTPQKATGRVCFWESANFAAYAIDDGTEAKLVFKAKTSGSKIELNCKDGASGKAETISIEARTGMFLYAQGLLDIRCDGVLQLQGRRVRSISGGDI